MTSGERSGRASLRWWHVVGSAGAGGLCWLLDMALLWVLALQVGLPVSLAAAISFVVAGVVNYCLNHAVFAGSGEPRTRSQVVRYVALTGVNIALTAVGVPLAEAAYASVIDEAGLSLLLAKATVTAALLVPNALMYRHWVFAAPRS